MSRRTLPTVTSDIPQDLRKFIDRVGEILATSSFQRFVTVNDLTSAGIAAVGGDGTLQPPVTIPVLTPPQPANLDSLSGYEFITLTWDAPSYYGHAYAKIYRAAVNVPLTQVFDAADSSIFTAGSNITSIVDRGSYVEITENTQTRGTGTTTNGASVVVPEAIALLFAGRRVRIAVEARAGTQSTFAVAYSTSQVGNSGALVGTAEADWNTFDFFYDVPATSNSGDDYVGIYAGNNNGSIDIRRITLSVQDDGVVNVGDVPAPPLFPGDAGFYAQTDANVFSDYVGNSQAVIDPVTGDVTGTPIFYYWVSFVNIEGVEGPYAGPVFGETAIDVEEVLRALVGQLTTTQFVDDLSTYLENAPDNYVVKLSGPEGTAAGFGLANTGPEDDPVFDFGILADNFFISPPVKFNQGTLPTPAEVLQGDVWRKNDVDPVIYYIAKVAGATAIAPGEWESFNPVPFIVKTTDSTVNGRFAPAGVYISDGFIESGTITTAKIGTAAIDKVAIADAAVTNAKIGYLDATKIITGRIQSPNFNNVAGYAGFLLDTGATSALAIPDLDDNGNLQYDAEGDVIFESGSTLPAQEDITFILRAAGDTTPALSLIDGDVRINAAYIRDVLGSQNYPQSGFQFDIEENTFDFKDSSGNSALYIDGDGDVKIQAAYILGTLQSSNYPSSGFRFNTVANTFIFRADNGDIMFSTGTGLNATYISNLEVDTAQIADLAVTEGKINDLAVDTIKIADQAVTIPTSAFTAARTTAAGSESVIQTVTHDGTGAPIEVFTSFGLINESNFGQAIIARIKKDGVTQVEMEVIKVPDGGRVTPVAFAWSDLSGDTGVRIYTTTLDSQGHSAETRYLRALETKK